MYDKRYFKVGDVVSFVYGKYPRQGKVVKLTDKYLTLVYVPYNVHSTDGAEVSKIKSFSYHKIYGLKTLELAQD